MSKATSQYRTLNPATGEFLQSFELTTEAEIEASLEASVAGFRNWRQVSLEDRAKILHSAAQLLEVEADDHARRMTIEMGKPIAQGRSEAEKCAWACRYYADNGAEFLAAQGRQSDGSSASVRFDPLGPILAIMPWNFPYWQVIRFAAPALMAGNAVLLKHSSNVPDCARSIADLFERAGLEPALFQNLYVSSEQAAHIIADARVRGVTLTGSEKAGREVASQAGCYLKPAVLELGGSDPFIVFEDADLEKAVETAVDSRLINNGQSCIAAKRMLVQRSIFDDFADAFRRQMESKTVGDPLDEATDVGPMAREDLRDELAEQVDKTVEAGGRILCGGEIPEGDGAFYPPTVLTDIPDNCPARDEELFGPVAPLFAFDTEEEAVELANSTDYGLGSSVWTQDDERAERLISKVQAGSVFINGMTKSDPRLPFGGIKDSGFGRELGVEGIRSFVNVKTAWKA